MKPDPNTWTWQPASKLTAKDWTPPITSRVTQSLLDGLHYLVTRAIERGDHVEATACQTLINELSRAE